jgi:hypothetical protein
MSEDFTLNFDNKGTTTPFFTQEFSTKKNDFPVSPVEDTAILRQWR